MSEHWKIDQYWRDVAGDKMVNKSGHVSVL